MVALLGSRDELLRVIEDRLDSDIHVRGNEITITGRPADNATAVRLFEELLELIRSGQDLSADSVTRVYGMLTADSTERPAEVLSLNILSRRGKNIRPKTLNQKRYVDAIDNHTIVFGIGPAGTGKTYLAVAKGVQALLAKQVNRIILTRPAVEAGERLGFLPGTLFDKIDPYLRPLFDALHDMLDPDSLPRLMQAGTIEIAPLAYMRGRAQPLDARVLTPEGYRAIGDLEVGDLVVGSNGLPTLVLGIYPRGRKPVYRITTEDGASTVACGEHLWAVRRDGDHDFRVVQTEDIMADASDRYELPLVDAVEFVPPEIAADPYAIGMLLADGHRARSVPRSSRAEEAALVGVRVRRNSAADYVAPDTAARAVVPHRALNARKKFVPREYLLNSSHVRLAVLQGLFDCDGELVTQSDGTSRIRYQTRSPRLREDIVFLVRSLGGVAYRDDTFVLDIRLPRGLPPFRLRRELAAYNTTDGGRPRRFIGKIEPAGRAETVCIQVAARDSLYVTDDLIVTHNSLNDAFIILDEAQNTTPEQMKMFLTRLGFGSKVVVTGDITQVDLPGDTRSGLRVVRDILAEVDDIHFANLTSSDVVRHRLVGDIVDAYERHDRVAQAADGTHSASRRAKPRR